tara:strand:+ start:1885 stop:2829 length:945 start_codon:yes stop_codon:yes gene_type:complete
MPRNVYFSQAVKSEQLLYEDLIIESLGIYGQDVYYIPRTIVNRDSILNEDPASTFDDAFLMEMYIENTEGFEGEGDLYSKFGLQIKDTATFVVSRRRWDDRVGPFSSQVENPKPAEGDLVFLPMTNSFFEINFVEDEQPFYQLSNLPVYKLECSLFEYNDEDFETGVEEIDTATAKAAYQLPLDVTITGGNHFTVGEIVEQIITPASGGTPAVRVFGEVQQRTKSSDILSKIWVSNIGSDGTTETKTFTTGATITGKESGFTGTIAKIYSDVTDTTGVTMPADEEAQNVDFELDADGFIDFSESNPFGDPSETF